VGLVTLNGIEFDLRGVVRLVGADTAKQNFFSAPPRRVEKIAVNQKATWIHVLHNCSTLPGIPHGSPLGRYLLQFEDGTETTLPIRYGVHLVTWSGNPFAVPTHAIFGWREGDYSDTKTLSHCTWENPEPTKVIQAITFESAGAPGSPFLVAMSLESTAPSASDRDVASILREARLKSTMVNGATTLTFDHVLALLKQAQPMVRDNPGLKIQHAIANAENMKARGLHGDALKQIEGLTSNDKDVENSLLKLRGRIHHAAGEFQSATKMLAMSVDQEDYRVGKPVGLDHLLTERLFHRHIAAKGKREARDFVLRSQIPPRQPATSGSAIDLTKSYNAGLHETWQRPNNASVVMPPLYRTMRSGVHHFRGIPFDIRGVINLTGGTRFEIVFPPRVSNIVVNRKADQLHFLNGGFNQAVTGTPVAVYRVVYSDGKAVDFPVRFRIEIGDCWIAGATGNIPNLVWRGEGAAAFNRKKDTALYLATWDNPRPDVTISHVDFVATLKRVNPYLVAITAESFEGSLDNVALAPRQLAERAVHKASLPNVSKTLRQHAVKLSQRATKLAPEDAEVWRLQSEMFLALRRADDAATSIAQSLELDPESGPSLYTREKVLVQLGQTGEALRTRSRARKMTLKGRITARDKSLSHKYIDLTSHYNAALNENPFLESKRLPYIDEKLTGLTDGLGSYNGISFDVRGVIALHGSETQLREHVAVLTNGVEGIPIGQKARAIHLLHGTSWGFRVPHGTTIGKYNFHYKDGSTEFVDIRYGEHVLDWFLRKKRTATKAKLAHSQRSIREADREVGCYQMTWVNPKPDVPISHIDFVSYETEAAPFLLGITLDTGDKAAPKK
jgi:tetratricopeptide (TPR) repeat protein